MLAKDARNTEWPVKEGASESLMISRPAIAARAIYFFPIVFFLPKFPLGGKAHWDP